MRQVEIFVVLIEEREVFLGSISLVLLSPVRTKSRNLASETPLGENHLVILFIFLIFKRSLVLVLNYRSTACNHTL